MPLDHDEIARLRGRQAGVVARWQVIGADGTPADFRRMVRSGRAMGPGVCVDHTGEPTWVQRAWAAVLAAWPAALAGGSALRAEAGPGWRGYDDAGPLEIAVDRKRSVVTPPGARLRHVSGIQAKVRWNLGPPRMTVEHATLDVALVRLARGDVLGTVEALAASVRARCTTAQRLIDVLDERPRVSDRAQLRAILLDVRDGTCSALEHGFLTLVERPHGLPSPDRQFEECSDGRTLRRDAEYTEWDVSVELDGEAFHARNRQRAKDMDRDLDLVVDARLAPRLGWAQVFDTPCRTAGKLARLLQRRGWTGQLVACGPGCVAPGIAAA